MKVILFGSSGMVGQAVLRECLIDPRVEKVLSIVRSTSGLHHANLEECVHSNFLDFSSLQQTWRGYDACFYCLGVSSAGLNESDYRRITYDFTLAAARLLAQVNPQMTFVYVSGAGTDSTERGRSMWARVKGATENALLALPFKAVMFRPGVIIPLHGIRSKTRSYRMFYAATRPLWGLLRAVWPNAVSTSEQVGRAMIAAARDGTSQPIMEARDINRVGKSV